MAAPGLDESRADLVQIIGGRLDRPSVYMGGPSPQSTRRAEDLLDHLAWRGYAVVKRCTGDPITCPACETGKGCMT